MKRILLSLLVICAVAFPAQHIATAKAPTAFRVPLEETVYVTKTGTKYHRGTCSYLRQSKRAISLADAKAAGYTPCSRCKPPE